MLRQFNGRRAALALDTPGFGQSFRPAGSPSAADYARWFLAAIDALQIDAFHLCAHHTGTHFAAELAVLAPQRVRSLLLSGVLYANAAERAAMRAQIGAAPATDSEGHYLRATWQVIRPLFPTFDPQLVHAELMGALDSAEGRNQAFDAILAQDFAATLRRVGCRVQIIQACDDPLMPMLARVRAAHPEIRVNEMGPAFLAAPERQAQQYAAAALDFAARNDPIAHTAERGFKMLDRHFTLVRSSSGFDLQQGRVERPSPGPGEVLIKVRAVSLNRRDLMIRELSYPVGEANNFVPLSDAAGEVAAVGAGVGRFRVGDRVVSTFFQGWAQGRVTLPGLYSALGAGGRGVLADHILLGEAGVAPVPAGWSFEEAACLPCAAVTAWSALVTFGQIQPKDWVLVIGTGGVALSALQIALGLGARVAILSSDDQKLARARALGASVAINYRQRPDWDVAVREATGGVQHVIELGGVGTLAKSLASTAIGGHIALIGALAGFGGDIAAAALIGAALRVSAVVVGSQAAQKDLTDFLVKQQIKPVIDKVFELDQIADAYSHAAKGAFGKVVIRL